MGRIVVTGPLTEYANDLRSGLIRVGYAPDTVREHVRLLADLSGWLAERDMPAVELSDTELESFLVARRAAGLRHGISLRALAPILEFLRGVGAIAPPIPKVPSGFCGLLLAEYGRYLEAERAASAGTVTHYVRCARVFLEFLARDEDVLGELSAGQVTGYVMDWARRREGRPPDMIALPALRSLLRFLHITGRVRHLLVGAVPAGRAHPARSVVPRAARPEAIRAVLDACDRSTPIGRRDFAIVLSLTRLALRGGEVARLGLADVGWSGGHVMIRGKGGRSDELPLPSDVGQAWADYLVAARPATSAETLFVTAKAPFTAMAVSSITLVLARACERAGVARFGPHRIRHAAACGLLESGASMEEIGQLLRHAHQRTTAIYAKVDRARLSQLVLPAPEGRAR